jgi:hypothetical protein
LEAEIASDFKIMLLENAIKYEEAITTAGRRAMQRAKLAGAPVYFMDPSISDGIIREMPDGSRDVVEISDGEDLVLRNLNAANVP